MTGQHNPPLAVLRRRHPGERTEFSNKMRLAQRFSEKWIRAAWSEMNCHDWLVSRNVRHVGDGVRSGDERGRNAQSRLAVSRVEVQPLSMSDVENDRHRATR
jgi:hypothetical protein